MSALKFWLNHIRSFTKTEAENFARLRFNSYFGFFIRTFSILTAFLLTVGSSNALAIDSLGFPSMITLNGKQLVLNGVGTRKATWFRIRVYHAALYLESKSNSTEQILSDSGTKELRMRFLRDVSKEDMVDAWTDGFIKNAIDYSAIKDNVAIFTALMVDVKEGDTFAIQFKSNTVEIFYNDSFAGAVSDHEFARDVLAIWLGDHPPNESLKEGLLGKEE